jgi:hypothetical protein
LPQVSLPFGLDFSKLPLSDAHLKNLAHLEPALTLPLWAQVTDAGLKDSPGSRNSPG